MSKYSYEERLEAVLRVIEEGMSYKANAKVLGIAQGPVQRWVNRYENYIPEGLQLRNGTYTGEFKQHVLQYMREKIYLQVKQRYYLKYLEELRS